MSTRQNCASCGAEIPKDAPNGLCPRCLIQGGLEDPCGATTVSATSNSAEGGHQIPPLGSLRYFGDYDLLEEIARGGMGIVYKARQRSLNRIVAIKMILAGQLAGAAEVKRFHTEAEAAANLQHPNIVAIHEVGEQDGQHYFSMDYVEGQNLAAIARATPMDPAKAARIMKTIAEAIRYAHLRGVYHRDLKPQNILVDAEGQPHVTDFGLAKRAGMESGLTQSGALMGSPNYMSPEQAQGKQELVGPASDIYSLGAILFELLTGQPPFRAESMMATLVKVVEEEPVPPRKLSPGVPQDIESICLKCLEKRPERRYSTAQELVKDLGRFLEHQPVLARPAGAMRRAWSWSQRHPWLITGAATAGLLVLICAADGLWQRTRYLHWQAAHPGEMPPLPLNFLIMISQVFYVLFIVIGTCAEQSFQQQIKRRRSEGQPIPARHMIGYALLGATAFIYGLCLVLKGVELWAWERPSRSLLLPMALVQGSALEWAGVYWLWRAIGAHESATFGHLVEKQIERRLAAAKRLQALQPAGGWDTTQLIVGAVSLMAGAGCLVSYLITPPHVLLGMGAVLGIVTGFVMIVRLRNKTFLQRQATAGGNEDPPAGGTPWLILSFFLSGFLGLFVAIVMQRLTRKRFWNRSGQPPAGTESFAGWPHWLGAAILASGFGLLLYLTASVCGSRWNLVKYQSLFAAPGERPDWGMPVVSNPPDELNFAKTPTLKALTSNPPGDPRLWDRFRSLRQSLGLVSTFPWAGERTDLAAIRDQWVKQSALAAPSASAPASAVQQAYAGMAAELAELQRASQRPLAQLDPAAPVSKGRELNLFAWRVLAQLLSVHASAALALGQAETAAQDCQVLLRLAALLNSRPGFDECMMRVLVVESCLQVFWEGWQARQWPAPQLAQFQSLLSSINLVRDFDNHLRFGEQVRFNAMMEKNMGGAQFTPMPLFQEGHMLYNRLLLEHQMAGYSSRQQAIFPRQVREHEKACERELARGSMAAIVTGMALPQITKALPQVARAQTYVNFGVLACALEKHRAEHGVYPSKLEDLAPVSIPRIPHDIINGGALHYRRTEDGRFLLYSVGWNETDEGGSAQMSGPRAQEPKDWVWHWARRELE